MTMVSASGERGFTLIEVMVSLGLFALIAAAGLGLVDGVMGVQERTEGRLDRTASVQRAMFVIASDFDQISAGPIAGGGDAVSLTRAAPGLGGPPVPVQYAIANGTLLRIAGEHPQVALNDVSSGAWQFLKDGVWRDRWPIDPLDPEARPDAVAVTLQTKDGVLRRVVTLPADASRVAQ
ncbi:prepilin-type N-terminal cleavage/methylation domain-containing protein [Stakelama sp. CBK3Z-3]|uniref:Prepilin-type N-terminal cleavage/methylation domain-containing protein n=1 Tax=Stakelama flava TaxID=2860338 RepID=A0ABS6XK67_9SPHN|nr:prepilin-type N-terminal cleavage/methylation domain-containing protein [Stakelama flava]MBW4330319.1 prepilin-type N-terminal cleavage/methylation domain-containing protein [Stakelama flava]